MKSDKLLLGVREAGEVIGIGRSTMYELLRSGEIESVRIGRCRRVPSLLTGGWTAGRPGA